MAVRWDRDSREFAFQRLLAEVLFHADLRFGDYIQYQDEEGLFPARLSKWLDNLTDDRHRRVLFQLLQWIVFIDRRQMRALYRDAYRRVIVPWIGWSRFAAHEFIAEDYEEKLRQIVVRHQFFSVTESLNFPEFERTNSLAGLRRAWRLGENRRRVRAALPEDIDAMSGVIVLEDFVGSGKQAGDVLFELRRLVPAEIPMLFVPLVILQRGLENVRGRLEGAWIEVAPVLTIRASTCLTPRKQDGEPADFVYYRSLVRRTSKRVLRRFGNHDDPPANAFGYKDCGALVITCQNAPNNALPLLHHRAPQWTPLFRRVHHSKDGL